MKICFIGNLLTTLVKRDYETLSKHFDAEEKERMAPPYLACKKEIQADRHRL